MNIFVTSHCPAESARFLDDKRVIKMVLESAQLLSTAINLNGGNAPYKTTHQNHPCNIWARESRNNYIWLLEHFAALCEEYTARYGKKHKCEQYIMDFENAMIYIPVGEQTPFANCAANNEMGISFKNVEDVTKAYKLYLSDRWSKDIRIPTWYKEKRRFVC